MMKTVNVIKVERLRTVFKKFQDERQKFEKVKGWKIYSSCFTYGESYVCLSLFSSQHSILVGVLGRYVSNHGMLH